MPTSSAGITTNSSAARYQYCCHSSCCWNFVFVFALALTATAQYGNAVFLSIFAVCLSVCPEMPVTTSTKSKKEGWLLPKVIALIHTWQMHKITCEIFFFVMSWHLHVKLVEVIVRYSLKYLSLLQTNQFKNVQQCEN